MALDLVGFRDSLRSVVAGAWPEVTRVLNVAQATRKTWQTLSQQLPYAVIVADSFPRSTNGPVCLDCREPVIKIYYVAQTKGLEDALTDKLEALAAVLYPSNPLAIGRTMLIEETSTADELLPNQVFTDANRSQRAGVVAVRCMVCG